MNRINARIIYLLIALVLFFSGIALAAEKPLKIRLAAVGGYDSNSGLNSSKKGDALTQESASVLYQRLMGAKAQLRLTYRGLNANYFEATDQNIFSNDLGAGVTYLLAPNTLWDTDYSFQYLDFTRNEAVTSMANELRMGLRQRLGERWNLRGGFTFSQRDYENKKLRESSGALSEEDERGDGRYALDGQILYLLRKGMVLSFGTVLSWNDSNDQFHDYYNYESYRFFTGLSWQIDPKWTVSTKLTYEKRDYDSRPIPDASETFQSDDSYTGNLSAYYKINANLSAGSVYTYRQKKSNASAQEFSGSLGTLGLYYSF